MICPDTPVSEVQNLASPGLLTLHSDSCQPFKTPGEAGQKLNGLEGTVEASIWHRMSMEEDHVAACDPTFFARVLEAAMAATAFAFQALLSCFVT